MNSVDDIRPGVLNKKQTRILWQNRHITNLKPTRIDLSSLDLHLSRQAWKMKGSVKPSMETTCDEIIKKHQDEHIDLERLKTLQVGTTYMIQIEEELKLPKGKGFCGRATGRSSIGRLDVLTRLMVDRCDYYDKVPPNYNGLLYLEVTPITFPIKVKRGHSLNQLRLFKGEPSLSELHKDQIELFGALILDEKGKKKEIGTISQLRVNLSPDKKTKVSAFQALKDEDNKHRAINIGRRKGSYDPKGFWTDIVLKDGEPLEIKKELFYILRSKERFRLPKDVAVSCRAITESLGEIRIHYAGFVHPFFGWPSSKGTPIIFEVRGHNVSTFLRDGATLANINFHRMSEVAIRPKKKGDYDDQELKLSKYFKDWGQE